MNVTEYGGGRRSLRLNPVVIKDRVEITYPSRRPVASSLEATEKLIGRHLCKPPTEDSEEVVHQAFLLTLYHAYQVYSRLRRASPYEDLIHQDDHHSQRDCEVSSLEKVEH